MKSIMTDDVNIIQNEGAKPEGRESEERNRANLTSELTALQENIAQLEKEKKENHKDLVDDARKTIGLLLLSGLTYPISDWQPAVWGSLGVTFGVLSLVDYCLAKRTDMELTGARIAMTKKQEELEQFDSEEEAVEERVLGKSVSPAAARPPSARRSSA